MLTSCRKCGEPLASGAKFCASCGAPVASPFSTLESKAYVPPSTAAPRNDSPPPTKASIPAPGAPAQPSSYGPPPPPANPPLRQPAAPSSPQPWPALTPYAAPAPGYPPNPAAYAAHPAAQGYTPAAQGYTPAPPPGYPPYAPPAPYVPAFVVGAHVLVLWADGNRYPGIVQKVAPAQCLISFPDGQQRWVEHQYLTLAR